MPKEIPPFDPFNNGNSIHGDIRTQNKGNSDNFGRLITNGIRNTVDLPSHYDYNRERYRIFQDGVNVEPSDIPNKFTDKEAEFLLEPDANETIRVQSAERTRYVVGVDASASSAAQITTPLETGDTHEIGLSDNQTPENKVFYELNGGADNRLVIVKGGVEVASDTWDYPGAVDETDQLRYEFLFDWYGVGGFEARITYTDSTREAGDRTLTRTVGEVTVDDDNSTNDGNFHIYQAFTPATADKGISVGSMGYLVLGDVSPTSRTKNARVPNLSYTGPDYEPILAVRIDADRGNVFSQLTSVEAVPDGGDGELLVIAVKESQTDATGFSTPPQHSPQNSVIEQTTNVTTFPDQDGNVVSTAADPNGYQVGFFSTDVTGTGATQSRQATTSRAIRPLYEDDIAIFLYNDDADTARDVNVVYQTRQLW